MTLEQAADAVELHRHRRRRRRHEPLQLTCRSLVSSAVTDSSAPPLAGLAPLLAEEPALRAVIAREPTVAVPDAARAAVRRGAGRGHDPPAARARGADGRRGRAARARPRAVPRRRRGRAVPGVGDAAVRAGVAVVRDDGPAPARDVAAPRPERAARDVVVAPVRALVQRLGPHVEERRAGRRAARATRSTATSSSPGSSRWLPARVPGRGAGRGRGAGLDRRRVPVHRRPPGAHRPLG